MYRFSVTTEFVQLSIDLSDKYVLISGDSGRGKSFLISEIERIIKAELDCIQSDIPYYLIQTKGEVRNIDAFIGEEKTIVFITDEFLAYDVIKAIENKNAYCIAVTRNVYKNINMSYRSLYCLERQSDGISIVKPKIKVLSKDAPESFDRIITEDSKAGFDFVLSFVRDKSKVVSAGGKSNIKDKLEKYKDDDNILIFADGGGLASEIIGIRRASKDRQRRGKSTWVCLPECLEHVLLCSDFIGWDKDIFKYFELSYNNTESFCEKKLKQLSKGKPFEFDHGRQKLAKCWTEFCENCNLANNCKYKLSGARESRLLSKGPATLLARLNI